MDVTDLDYCLPRSCLWCLLLHFLKYHSIFLGYIDVSQSTTLRWCWVEVFALVYLQIGLLCLQIVIIAAPIAISYGDSVLVLDRKVQGIKWSTSSSLLRHPWLAWVAVDVTDLDYCLPHSCLLVEMTWITCIKKLETCARESEPHHTRRKVTIMSLERNRTCVSLY